MKFKLLLDISGDTVRAKKSPPSKEGSATVADQHPGARLIQSEHALFA